MLIGRCSLSLGKYLWHSSVHLLTALLALLTLDFICRILHANTPLPCEYLEKSFWFSSVSSLRWLFLLLCINACNFMIIFINFSAVAGPGLLLYFLLCRSCLTSRDHISQLLSCSCYFWDARSSKESVLPFYLPQQFQSWMRKLLVFCVCVHIQFSPATFVKWLPLFLEHVLDTFGKIQTALVVWDHHWVFYAVHGSGHLAVCC